MRDVMMEILSMVMGALALALLKKVGFVMEEIGQSEIHARRFAEMDL
jgi:hypothetical protein